MRILVLGATGSVGRTAAAELARSSEVDRLWLGGRDENRLAWVASSLETPRGRVVPAVFDLRDEARRRRCFSELAGGVIASCAGPASGLEAPAARDAVGAGAAWVSLCDDYRVIEEVLELAAAAEKAGVTVLSGCGLSPGISNLLVARAAAELDEVEEVDIAVARSARDLSGPAEIAHYLGGLGAPATAVSEGRPSFDPGSGAAHLVYFPDPVGWVETFGMARGEVATLPRSFPGLRSLRTRAGITEKTAMDALRAAVSNPVARRLGPRLWPHIAPVLQQALASLPGPGPAWSAVRVDVRGRSESRPRSVSLGVVDHLVNLAAVPLVAAVLDVGAGRTASGAHAPEKVLDPGSFLARISRRGLRVARLEPYPL